MTPPMKTEPVAFLPCCQADLDKIQELARLSGHSVSDICAMFLADYLYQNYTSLRAYAASRAAEAASRDAEAETSCR